MLDCEFELQKKKPGRILVVDDELTMRELLREVLRASGYQVETVENGEAALQQIDSPGKYHILITDIYMPGLDGLELLRRAKKIDKSLEVIVITGYGSLDTAVEAMKKGAFDYISKPFNIEHIKLVLTKALEKIRLRKAAQKAKLYRHKSNLDALTRLYNHKAFFQLLEKELTRSKRYTRPLTLIVIDIDDFKLYNDTYGHQAGDRALTKVSLLLKKASRRMDLVARYGGEEFAIIAPETPKGQAGVMAERLREKIEKTPLEENNGQLNRRITISVGISGFPEDADTSHLLVKRADEALYYSKTTGKNRLTTFNFQDP